MALDRSIVSLRLKAGRYLAGRIDEKGRAIPLPVSELAEHPLLQENAISRNRLEEFEQMRTDARPMELEKVALALGLSTDWFRRSRPSEKLVALRELTQALADLGLVPDPSSEQDASGEVDTDRQRQAAGGADE
jgi:hypothetical protein